MTTQRCYKKCTVSQGLLADAKALEYAKEKLLNSLDAWAAERGLTRVPDGPVVFRDVTLGDEDREYLVSIGHHRYIVIATYRGQMRQQVREAIERLLALNPTDKQLWDILTALRGPDAQTPDDYALKVYTTGRVRDALGLRSEGYFLVKSSLTAVEVKARDEALEKSSDHFSCHYTGAVRAIRELYGYDLKEEKSLP